MLVLLICLHLCIFEFLMLFKKATTTTTTSGLWKLCYIQRRLQWSVRYLENASCAIKPKTISCIQRGAHKLDNPNKTIYSSGNVLSGSRTVRRDSFPNPFYPSSHSSPPSLISFQKEKKLIHSSSFSVSSQGLAGSCPRLLPR